MRVIGVQPKAAVALRAYFQYDPEMGWRGRSNAGMRFVPAAFPGYTSCGVDGFGTIERSREDASAVVWCVDDLGTWGWGVSRGHAVFRNLGVRDAKPIETE